MKHGHTARRQPNSPTYISWRGMIERCSNPNNISWKHYGALGITVFPPWRSFVRFLADVGLRPAGTSLDRFPNKRGNYEPGNVRWATPKQQANNMVTNTLITHNGRTQSIGAWEVELGLQHNAI